MRVRGGVKNNLSIVRHASVWRNWNM